METLENHLTQSYFHLQRSDNENDTGSSGKGITIALLTDALFSDAGSGLCGATRIVVLDKFPGVASNLTTIS